MHEIRSTIASGAARQLIAPKAKAKRAAGGSLSAVAIPREEVRRSDQRREDREVRPHSETSLTFRRRKHDVQLVNISSHGAMIACDILPRIGEIVAIRFEDCNPIKCAVRWVRDGRIGVEFNRETVVLAPRNVQQHIFGEGNDAGKLSVRPERAERHGFIWRGTLHSHNGPLQVRLRNISSEGAMLECDSDLAEGTEVVLDLGPGGNAPGLIRWCRSGQLGLKFNEPFEMRGLAISKPAAVASPQMVQPKYLATDGKADSPWAAAWDKFGPEDL